MLQLTHGVAHLLLPLFTEALTPVVLYLCNYSMQFACLTVRVAAQALPRQCLRRSAGYTWFITRPDVY